MSDEKQKYSRGLMRLFTSILILAGSLFAGSFSHASLVYDQMSSDFDSLESAIQNSIQTVEKNQDGIAKKSASKNKGIDLLGFVITRSNVRVTAFRLQGVLRLLNTSSDFKTKEIEKIRALLKNVKTIEDVIGKMDEALTTLNNALKKGASESKLKALREKADAQSKLVVKTLRTANWLNDGGSKKSKELADFLNSLDRETEVLLIQNAIAQELNRFQLKIAKELLAGMKDMPFSHDSMEYNFHEFRREIRWAAIYFSSVPSIFSLTPYTLEGHTPDQQNILIKYKGNKYAEIDSENSPIQVDRYTFYLLAHYVSVAGDAKDVAEEHFKLLEAGIDSTLDEQQFKSDMVKMMEDFLNDDIFTKLKSSSKLP
jgi:hypothetical protein